MKIDLKWLKTSQIQSRLRYKKIKREKGEKEERRLGKDRLLYKAVQKKK